MQVKRRMPGASGGRVSMDQPTRGYGSVLAHQSTPSREGQGTPAHGKTVDGQSFAGEGFRTDGGRPKAAPGARASFP